MRWYLKSAGFKVLSAVPGGAKLYAFAQQHVTRSTTPNRPRVEQKIGVGLQYWQWLKAHGRAEALRDGAILDFGAGWHPTIPLLNYSLGVPKQFLLDLTPLMASQRVVDTVRIFRDVVSDPGWPARGELRRVPEPVKNEDTPPTDLLGRYGFSYHAPYDPASGALRAAADAVFCTQVLLHISREGLGHCFQLLHDCLKPGGLLLATIHLMDLYSMADARITPYNHLKFSPQCWERWVNSSLMPFNRLKARDYRELLVAAGFSPLHFEVNAPSDADFAQLDSVKIHPYFQHYTREELVARHLFVVAQRS